MRVGFFGTGNMGAPMARNLIRANHEVALYDIIPAAAEAVLSALPNGAATNARVCRSVKETCAEAEVILSILPNDESVRALYLGEDGPNQGGVLQHASVGTVLIDSSTISARGARAVAEAAATKGFAMLDAPVSGGTVGAEAGTLSFICGGAAETIVKVRPLLEVMGANIFHAGDHGAGQIAKFCNNMAAAIHMLGTSEALSLGVSHGLDPQTLTQIMNKSSGGSWSTERYNPFPGVMPQVPASKGYQGGFSVNLMAKDLGLAGQAAVQSGSSTPLGALCLHLYRAHAAAGYGQLDFSSILELVRKPEKA